ncbi:MAG TPA: helix-turn-helix domain-containing protein [Actinomycetota bacterium]|nr:helix-turn-helix domain-containing protein [Actinomycetota bacterium]
MPERTDSPLEHALQRVGDRWTMLVIDALQSGPRRFNELIEAVRGIAPNILSQRLKRLEREGILLGRPYSTRPVRLSYELTAAGRELAGTLRLLAQWGATGPDQPETVAHQACGTPMEARWYCPTCATAVLDDEENEELRFL